MIICFLIWGGWRREGVSAATVALVQGIILNAQSVLVILLALDHFKKLRSYFLGTA